MYKEVLLILSSHFYNGTQGTYAYAGSGATLGSEAVYAAAYMVQPNPALVCPYYHQQYYTDGNGNTYYVVCGNAAATTAGAGTPSGGVGNAAATTKVASKWSRQCLSRSQHSS